MATSSSATSTVHAADEHKDAVHDGVLQLPTMHVPHVHVSFPGGTAGRVLWWGGLATMAAMGVVEWPVAALVGAGSWIAEQYAKAAMHADGERPQDGGTRRRGR
ncbi:MAG: hypothetical protein ACXV3F_05375 [Frankiaceae bacterium]